MQGGTTTYDEASHAGVQETPHLWMAFHDSMDELNVML